MAEKRSIKFKFKGLEHDETIEGNLEMGDVSPVETREAMNRAVGKYAYYGALLAEAKKLQSKLSLDWDFWYGEKYLAVCDEEPKGTEALKNTKVMLSNKVEYEERQEKLRNIASVLGKIDALRSAYKLQATVLQTIGSMLRTELELYSRGSGHTGNLIGDEEEDDDGGK